jgi:hypothetical protein
VVQLTLNRFPVFCRVVLMPKNIGHLANTVSDSFIPIYSQIAACLVAFCTICALGCHMVYQKSQSGHILVALEWKLFVSHFLIFCGHMVNFEVIWYILRSFGIF